MKALLWSTHYAVTTTRRTKAKFESEVVREWTDADGLFDGKESGRRARARARAGGGDSQTGNEMRGGQGLSCQFLEVSTITKCAVFSGYVRHSTCVVRRNIFRHPTNASAPHAFQLKNWHQSWRSILVVRRQNLGPASRF